MARRPGVNRNCFKLAFRAGERSRPRVRGAAARDHRLAGGGRLGARRRLSSQARFDRGGRAVRAPPIADGVVPLAGIEPALLAELDFESSASTSSATGAPRQATAARYRTAAGARSTALGRRPDGGGARPKRRLGGESGRRRAERASVQNGWYWNIQVSVSVSPLAWRKQRISTGSAPSTVRSNSARQWPGTSSGTASIRR